MHFSGCLLVLIVCILLFIICSAFVCALCSYTVDSACVVMLNKGSRSVYLKATSYNILLIGCFNS